MSKRVLLFGASGTIGQAAARAIIADGHDLTCFLRPSESGRSASRDLELLGAKCRFGDVSDPQSITRDAFADETFEVVASCLASRTGTPKDAWAIDYRANLNVLEAAAAHRSQQIILLSAICVQKPKLAFQHAKLAFERDLMQSGLAWSIVRPTAFFKSLSGQIERVKRGKPFLLFGDGELTRCKPISDADLGRYISSCIDNPDRLNRILPVGGPGPAISPREQAEKLFELTGKPPRFRHVPPVMMDAIISVLDVAGKISQRAADKAEYARIGRYYATESMLVWNAEAGRYDEDATPETGSDTLFEHYENLIG